MLKLRRQLVQISVESPLSVCIRNFNVKIDSPPSANDETSQKFLKWLAVLSLKVWEEIFLK